MGTSARVSMFDDGLKAEESPVASRTSLDPTAWLQSSPPHIAIEIDIPVFMGT